MSNGLLYIAGLMALALAALFAVPYFIDWNGYRGVFEEEATRILGREVRVGGNVNVRFLPAPFVRFDKLRIADTTGTGGEPFFRAESFTMRLSVPPLLKGIIEANEIELKRPVLRLALDAQGGGNWRTLSVTPGALPFVPAGVTLQSVRIKDGVVALHGPKGIGFAELEGLNGELKADSIEGPYSFKGTAKWRGADREIRIATAAPDSEGAVRFKATVHGSKRSNAYTVDGRVFDLKGRPRVDGNISAKLELDAAKPPQGSEGAPLSERTELPLADFKAGLVGDADGLRLDDITLSFERIGQPQLITGSATASWSEALKVDLNLASRWLDLDRIAGRNGTASPFETARSFVSTVMQALPTKAETDARFDLDQANLGGEAVSGVRLEVARTNGALLLKDLRASLPGGAKLTLDGTLADSADARAFQGEIALRGSSLGRFLTWAVKDETAAEVVGSEGPFSLQGRLGMSDQAIDLTDAGAEIGGMPLTGAVHYSRGERPRLAVALDGQEIDGDRLWPAGVGYLKSLMVGSKTKGEETQAAAAAVRSRWFDPATSDLMLHLRAGRLVTGNAPLRDVDMDVAIETGRLSLRALKFVADDGLAFELEGDIGDVKGRPRGALRWVFAAPSRDAFSTFVKLLSLPDAAADQAMGYVGLAPMRVAGTIRLGARNATAADIDADGSIRGGRVVATARLDNGLGDWRTAGADLALAVESRDVVQAFNTLTAMPPGASAEPDQRAGEIFFKAVGTPAKGMLTTASIKAAGLYFAYDGHVELPPEGSHKFDGEVRVSARELADVVAIAGLGSGGALRGAPIIGTVKMTSANHAIELEAQELKIAGSKVDGTLALAHPAEGPAIVTAQLKVDKASIPGLLSAALDRSSAAAVAAEPLTEGKSIWPKSAFDFAALEGVEGKLGINFDTLSLEEGMDIDNARLEVALAPGKYSVTRLEGKAAGGDLLAAATLEKVPGGARLTGDVRLTGALLAGDSEAGAAKKPKAATASLELELSGRGATTSGLIAVATGKGEITLPDMSLRVPTPLAVVATSEAVLSGDAGGSGDELLEALREKISESEVKVGPRTISIEIADGAAKLVPFELPSPAGTTKVTTTVDLASLVVDSAWLLQPKAPDVERPDRPRKGALPGVNVVYTGPLKDAWTLEPHISADALERELAIRKMELDAEQLERLHRLDAERARQEEERQKALQADPGDSTASEPAAPATANDQTPLSPQGGTPLPPQAGAAPASGGFDAEPPLPGSEAQVVPLQPGDDPNAAGAPSPEQAAEAAQPPPQTTYRPRRAVRRQVPAGEQVLRSLQNSTN